jgi:hypothetical protein
MQEATIELSRLDLELFAHQLVHDADAQFGAARCEPPCRARGTATLFSTSSAIAFSGLLCDRAMIRIAFQSSPIRSLPFASAARAMSQSDSVLGSIYTRRWYREKPAQALIALPFRNFNAGYRFTF